MRGRYCDGTSALVRTVEVKLTPTALLITDEHGHDLAQWQLSDLSLEDHTVHSATAPEARLTVDQPQRLVPFLPRRPRDWRLLARLAATLAAAPILVVALWLAIPPAARFLTDRIPATVENRLGDSAIASLTQGWPICTDAHGTTVLAALVRTLSSPVGSESRPRQVVVVDGAMNNAFALPGGHIVILRGLLDKAASPDQVAGVLAHEMSHVHHRHALAATSRAIGVSALATLVLGDATGLAGTVGGALIGFSYSRPDEETADADAVSLLNRVGIDPEGLASMFETFGAEGWNPPTLLSSHPDLADRAGKVRAGRAASAYRPALTPDQWTALKRICATVTP
jgi:predicted Zn-dependent protease